MPCPKPKWRTRKKGSLKQIGKKFKAGPKTSVDTKKLASKTMFFPAKGKYADIVKLDTVENAQKAADELLREFNSAKTRTKKVRIKKVTVLASNRAYASAKRKKLSYKERQEFKQIGMLYRDYAKVMELD